ncbi:MAG: hypothetical protein KBT04_08225, partial [Bacteroidales bacterium]|nr:hypothetical protein [Candidatus Colimorpha onthohippi]
MLRTLTFLWLLLGTTVVLAQHNSDCGTPLKNSDKDRFKDAVAAYEKKDYKKASETLRKIARTNPQCTDVQFYLGIIGAAENNAAAIRKYFGKLLKLCPSYPDPRAHLYDGIIHYSDEDYDGAVTALNHYFDLLNAVSTATLNENIEVTFKNETALANRYLYWSQFLADAHRNQVPFNPTVMLGASSPQTELMPFITHEGQEIYYIRHVPEESGTTYYGRELQHTTPMICLSRWKDTSFSAGTPLPEPFNTHTSEGGITITADGKHC